MTMAHLVFAMATTAYIFIAIQLEEGDLLEKHPEYLEYRKRVPMIFLRPRKWKTTDIICDCPAKAA
jgi:protein-S-isoprenylcysteine O-methyltransferase Ste14